MILFRKKKQSASIEKLAGRVVRTFRNLFVRPIVDNFAFGVQNNQHYSAVVLSAFGRVVANRICVDSDGRGFAEDASFEAVGWYSLVYQVVTSGTCAASSDVEILDSGAFCVGVTDDLPDIGRIVAQMFIHFVQFSFCIVAYLRAVVVEINSSQKKLFGRRADESSRVGDVRAGRSAKRALLLQVDDLRI